MNYHKIEKTSISNGEGIRVVLWVSGCRIGCKGCHNKETWSFNSGKLFDEDVKKELFEALDKSYIQGITFSGGHPLESENVEVIRDLIIEIKEKFPSKNIWLYTGFTWDEIFKSTCKTRQQIVSECDVLVDGRYINELRNPSAHWVGSTNQRVIDIQKSLRENRVVLYG